MAFVTGLLADAASADEDKRRRRTGADYRVVGVHTGSHQALAVDEEVVHGIIPGGPGQKTDAEVLEQDILSTTAVIGGLVVGPLAAGCVGH